MSSDFKSHPMAFSEAEQPQQHMMTRKLNADTAFLLRTICIPICRSSRPLPRNPWAHRMVDLFTGWGELPAAISTELL